MYQLKKFLNKVFGCEYKLDIYSDFHNGDEKAARLIREGNYAEYNDYAMSFGGSHSTDGGKTVHKGLFDNCKECKKQGYKSAHFNG
jgi:hypothetical protein